MAAELKRMSDNILTNFFSIIYCSYRKGFKPLLTENKEIKGYVQHLIAEKSLNEEKIMTSTDANWGCTIRVG